MPLFEVAIIQTPTKKEAEEGTPEKLVFPPKVAEAGAAKVAPQPVNNAALINQLQAQGLGVSHLSAPRGAATFAASSLA